MKNLFTLLVILTSSFFHVFSADNVPYIQYLPEYMPQAPNAQAFARSIDIPVNHYTGIPNISIPLYTIKVGSFSIPITLNYQGGGIRPSQEATSVGLGWNLNAGGAITRTVKCADDFMEYHVPGSQFIYGFFDKQNWPNLSIIDYDYYRKIDYKNSIDESNWITYLCVDSEPDLYYYCIPNYNGKFSFKKDKSVVYFDKSQNVKINPPFGIAPYFSAIDALGNSYRFELKERTSVYSGVLDKSVNVEIKGLDITTSGPNNQITMVSDYTSTWFLTEVVTASNDTILYEYEDESFLLPLQENCRYMNRINGSSLLQEGNGVRRSVTKTRVESKRLTQIKWRGGIVKFEYNAEREDLCIPDASNGDPCKLTDIKVFNPNNLLVCHWNMSYGYFNNELQEIPSNLKHLYKRLRLNSIRNVLTGEDPYIFNYYEVVSLPVKNTKNLDFWGFYNGIDQGKNYYSLSASDTRKAADDYYCKVGILESVKHPTGGITKLYWESNKINETLVFNESTKNSHYDSYTKGFLKSCKSMDSEYPAESSKCVLLSRKTGMYFLLSSKRVGSLVTPALEGTETPFIIERIDSDGTRTLFHSWSITTIGDENEYTLELPPGTYEFKCKAMADNVEYCMYFIDSINKHTTKKTNNCILYAYNGCGINESQKSESTIITLDHKNVVIFNCWSEIRGENITIENLKGFPFQILKEASNGTFETIANWQPSDFPLYDEKKSLTLEAGTYKIKCEAIIDNVLFCMSIDYGETKYTPTNINEFNKEWNKNLLATYKSNLDQYQNLDEEETDTIVINENSKLFLRLSYIDFIGDHSIHNFANTYPICIYKMTKLGIFETLFKISATCITDIESTESDAMGIYLEKGTYIIDCKATADNIIFIADYAYKKDEVRSSNGAAKGGLRIARIEGEKNIRYLYGGGVEIIPPCICYKEKHIYDDGAVTYEVKPSESVRPLSSYKNGNIIGYSKVAEIYDDNSRMEHTFYNEEEELEDPDFPYSPSYTNWNNGTLLSSILFNEDGDTVSMTLNSYRAFLTEPVYKVGFIEIRPYDNFDYHCRVECPMLSHSVHTEFRDNGKLTTRQEYFYNNNLLCIEKKETIGSDIHKTIYKYADDFSNPISQKMIAINQIGIPVVELSMRNGVIYSGTQTIFGNFNELQDNGNTVVCGSPTWDTEVYLPSCLLTLNTTTQACDFASCKFDTTIVFNSYTNYGNIRELNYKGMPITYIWSYEGMYPIAEFKNTTYQQFKSYYGTTNLDMDKIIYRDAEYIRDRLLGVCDQIIDASVTTNLYSPLIGITERIDNKRKCYVYKYDAAGRLSSIRQETESYSNSIPLHTYAYGKNFTESMVYPEKRAHANIKSIQYYDEWGRPSISAQQGAMQDASFSYGMKTYDWKGRPCRTYSFVPSNSKNGELLSIEDFLELSLNAFGGDSYGYAQTTYDAMERIISTTTPGYLWHDMGKATTFKYLTNEFGEVKKYIVKGSDLLESGYYAANTLDCTVKTDPDGQTIRIYKDVFGNVILERRADHFDTYYVYDELNCLRYVLSPKYQEEKRLDYYAYQYEYDGHGRVIKKTLPGCSPIRFWYDSRDRLVKMQDGILAQSGTFRLWEYDMQDRMVSQGIQNSKGQYYDEIYNYYDNYDFVNDYLDLFSLDASGLFPTNLYCGKGQLTGQWQRASNDEDLVSVLGYDEMGYLSKKSEIGLGGIISKSDYVNNSIGKVIEEHFSEYLPTLTGLQRVVSGTIENNYSYPHTNLLTSSVITIADQEGNMLRDTIQHLTYDKFGNIIQNDRSGIAADMTYSYDTMHGWLTSIKSSKGFEQKLYHEIEGSVPCFNGNISAMTWKTGNDYLRRFDYKYTAMNWLKRADFSYYKINQTTEGTSTLTMIPYVGVENEDYTCEYDYDRNGNVTGAYRQGLVDNIEDSYGLDYDTTDDYTVYYRGNQLRAVNGNGTGSPTYYGSSAFIDGIEDGDDEYAYNANGALIKDLNKGITNIEYDALNNLRKISFTGNRNIQYVYAADGRRLRTEHARRVGNSYISESTTYCGNLILKSGKPSMFLFTGGFYSFVNNRLKNDCHYYIQDYLGNNRMVVSKSGAIEQITHYYPYGGIIGGIDKNPNFQHYKYAGKELTRTYGLEWYDVCARQYDPVVPSWNSIDPMAEKYYWLSPYSYCANNPVKFVDPDGRKIVISKDASSSFIEDYNMTIQTLFTVGCGNVWKQLNESNETYTIIESDNSSNYFDPSNKTISWNSRMGILTTSLNCLSPATRLNHELDHALQFDINPDQYKRDVTTSAGCEDETYSIEEKRVIEGTESQTATRLGEIEKGTKTRTDHSGNPFSTNSPISNINPDLDKFIIKPHKNQ